MPDKMRGLCIDGIDGNGNRGKLQGHYPLTDGIYLLTCFL
jgi:hypothetical protein